jgi:hypothetical protein
MAIPGRTDYFRGSESKSPAQRTDSSATQQRIKDRAGQIWEKMGKPQGQDLAIWLKAEKEILGSGR